MGFGLCGDAQEWLGVGGADAQPGIGPIEADAVVVNAVFGRTHEGDEGGLDAGDGGGAVGDIGDVDLAGGDVAADDGGDEVVQGAAFALGAGQDAEDDEGGIETAVAPVEVAEVVVAGDLAAAEAVALAEGGRRRRP